MAIQGFLAMVEGTTACMYNSQPVLDAGVEIGFEITVFTVVLYSFV